jgi:DNA-binding winged helix-turn-helix (wHTH) protein
VDQQALKVHKEPKELKGHKEQQVVLVRLVPLVRQDLQVQLEFKELKVLKALRELQDRWVPQDQQAQQVFKVHKERLE